MAPSRTAGRIGLASIDTKTLRKALNVMGKDAEKKVQDASVEIAMYMQQRMTGNDALSSTVARSGLRVRKGKNPAIVAGGGKRVGVSGNASSGDVFFGSEFGSKKYRQFRGTSGSGYWFWPTLRRETVRAEQMWADAFLEILKEW